MFEQLALRQYQDVKGTHLSGGMHQIFGKPLVKPVCMCDVLALMGQSCWAVLLRRQEWAQGGVLPIARSAVVTVCTTVSTFHFQMSRTLMLGF